MYCPACASPVSLSYEVPRAVLDVKIQEAVKQDRGYGKLRTRYEAALVSIKSLKQDSSTAASPTAFISYAHGSNAHEYWAAQLATDIRNAGIQPIFDQWQLGIGDSKARFMSEIEASAYVLVVGTPLYRLKYKNDLSPTGNGVATEIDLINIRLTGSEQEKRTVLPLLLVGNERVSFPPLLVGRIYADFTKQEVYFMHLFDIVLKMLGVPFDHQAIADLRAGIRDATYEVMNE